MKILATAGRDTVIVEATRDEIARCMGYAYESSIPSASRFDVGSELDVCEAYQLATEIIGSSRELKEATEKIEKVTKAIGVLQKHLDSKAQIIKSKMP